MRVLGILVIVLFGLVGTVAAQNPIVPIYTRTLVRPDDTYLPIGSYVRLRMMDTFSGGLVDRWATVSAYFVANDGSRPPEYEFEATVNGMTGHYQLPIKDNLGVSFFPE